MTVRTATLRDTDELLRLAALMFESVGLDTSGDDWRVAARHRVGIGFDDGTVAAFVVDAPDDSTGAVAAAAVSLQRRLPTPANPEGVVAYVQWVATDPAHRRRGHARALMESVVTWAREHGAGSVDLHASADGQVLYRSLGFRENRNPELRLPL